MAKDIGAKIKRGNINTVAIEKLRNAKEEILGLKLKTKTGISRKGKQELLPLARLKETSLREGLKEERETA